MVASFGTFPADLDPLFLIDWTLLSLGLILKIELRQLPEHPKYLSVKLLFKIGLDHVTEFELFAHEGSDLDNA